MTIGISAYASSTQIYQQLEERGFKTWFRTRLPFNLTLGVQHMLAKDIPDPSVETDLSNAIFKAANTCRDFQGGACGMKVYCGRGYSGKSVSSKLAIRRAIGDVALHGYPAVYVNAQGDLVQATRKALDIPHNMDDNDWIEILFHHLSARNQVKSPPSFILGVECGCFFSGRQDGDTNYTNTPGNLPPMIVLDNVRTLLPDTINLLEQTYQHAKVHRVLAVVITDRVEVANYIVGMNGARVAPLEYRFQLEGGLPSYAIVPLCNYPRPRTIDERIAKGIVWQDEEWPRSKQHEYLVKFPEYDVLAKETRHVSEFDGYFKFLVPGESPAQALLQARQYVRQNVRRHPCLEKT